MWINELLQTIFYLYYLHIVKTSYNDLIRQVYILCNDVKLENQFDWCWNNLKSREKRKKKEIQILKKIYIDY